MTRDQAIKKLGNAYNAVGGWQASAVPWETIITALLELLAGCSTTAAKAFGKAHPVALEFLLQRKLLETMMAVSTKERKLLAKAGVKAFNSTSAAMIDQLR